MPDFTVYFDNSDELAQYMALDPAQQAAYIRILARKEGLDKSCLECTLNGEQQENSNAAKTS